MCSRIGGQAASVPEDKSRSSCRDTSAPTNRIAAAPVGRLSRWDVVNTETLGEIVAENLIDYILIL